MMQAKFRHGSFIRHQSTINNLPESLLIEVFKRLPEAKFIIRCQLVCRNWYVIISAEISTIISNFVTHHLKKNDDDDDGIINYERISHFVPKSRRMKIDCFPVFLNDDDGIINYEKISHFVPKSRRMKVDFFPVFLREISEKASVIASCNDLLLCRLGSSRRYCICNPYTKQYAILPPTPNKNVKRGTNVVVGFVCDSYVSKKDRGQYWVNPHYNYRVVLIYIRDDAVITLREFSSEANKWTDRYTQSAPYSISASPLGYIKENMVFHKGMGFWINTTKKNICTYDPHQNDIEQPILSAIKAPRVNANELRLSWCTHCLGVCQGFLRYFILTVPPGDVFPHRDDITARVWELKDLNSGGEWSLVHNVKLCQLGGDLWWSVVKQRIRHSCVLLETLAIDPSDPDIVYIKAGVDYFDIVSCNLREMETKLLQSCFDILNCVSSKKDVFPVVTPMWPTPIRSRAH